MIAATAASVNVWPACERSSYRSLAADLASAQAPCGALPSWFAAARRKTRGLSGRFRNEPASSEQWPARSEEPVGVAGAKSGAVWGDCRCLGTNFSIARISAILPRKVRVNPADSDALQSSCRNGLETSRLHLRDK